MKHTQGPWGIYKGRIHFTIDAGLPYANNVIAKVMYSKANAQLIATAPELLKTCKNFFEWHAIHFEEFSNQINNELLCLANECEQAITNAEKIP